MFFHQKSQIKESFDKKNGVKILLIEHRNSREVQRREMKAVCLVNRDEALKEQIVHVRTYL